MYKVYLNDEILQDSTRFLIDPKLELTQNAAGSFSFGMYPEHPCYDKITPTSVIRIVQELDDGTEQWIWSGRMTAPAEEFDLYRTFDAEGVLAYLADSIQRPAEYHDISVIDFLSELLEIHNSQVDGFKHINLGIVTVTDPNDSLYRYTNYEDTLSAIKDKLVDRLGGILRMRHEADGLYLDYLSDYPRLSLQHIQFGDNLMDLLQESSYTDVATVLIPLGARLEDDEKSPDWPEALEQRVTIASANNGKDYLIDNSAASSSGKVVKVATWDDVHVPTILKAKAQDYLDKIKYESRTITAKAIDLSTAGFDVDDFRFLDRIRIISEPHGIDLTFPLTAMTIYLLEPEKNVYTLGSAVKTYTSSQSSSQISIKETLASLPARISDAREKAIANATQILQQWASLGYAIHTENESYYMDSPNKEEAQNVLRINSGGIGFSTTGFDGPYINAWTLDGVFNTEFIQAGSIKSDMIEVKYKQDLLNAAEELTDDKLKDYSKTTEFTVKPGEIKATILDETKKTQDALEEKLAEIRLETDQITLEVADKVGTSEISSLIQQNADAIRLKATSITWDSENSSMTEQGVLTCKSANMEGDISMKKHVDPADYVANIGTITALYEDETLERVGLSISATSKPYPNSSVHNCTISISPAPVSGSVAGNKLGRATSIISCTGRLLIEAFNPSELLTGRYATIKMNSEFVELGGAGGSSSGHFVCLRTAAGATGGGGSLFGHWDLPDHFYGTITDKTSYAGNVWINGYGKSFLSCSTSSSRRYKHDITDVDDDLDPTALYDLPVRSFTFNDGYLPDADPNANARMIGFIAEEVAAVYPKAAQYNPDGTVEMWNYLIMIPAMLALIQSQNERLKKLEGENL